MRGKKELGFFKTGVSAIGNLLIVAGLAAAFLLGMFGVVVLSLRGDEIKVPEVTGRDFFEAEKELAQLGLKIKRRATRYSEEKPNTVLEQSPRPGEPIKTGNTILVVISQANPEGQEAPATIKNEEETPDDTATDIDLDKPKKTTKNANIKKPQTTRDVVANKDNKNTNTSASGSNTGTPKPGSNTSTPPGGANRGGTPPSTKPSPGGSPSKGQTGGDTRTRKVPQSQ